MKKKRRKIGIVICMGIFIILLGIGGTAFYNKQQETKPQEETALIAGEDQELVEVIISSIVGNEVETQEGKLYRIPVGTEVVTKLGNITTFSRLASGDKIQLLIETEKNEEVIQKIKIVD